MVDGNIYDEIFRAALSLPPGLKAMLVEELLKSLDSAQQTEIDALWAEEAERRIQEIKQGTVRLIPGEQVFQKLRSRGQ